MLKKLSWNDRFALIDTYTPSDADICAAFGVNQGELDTARSLRQAGTFIANAQLDVKKYANAFTASGSVPQPQLTSTSTTTKTKTTTAATVHTKPETATKKSAIKVPGKRGRKGDKIVKAFQSVTTTPVPVESFIKEHGVSLAVLRQAKRFLEKMDPATVKSIGKINVRQEKGSKTLMIWRETI